MLSGYGHAMELRHLRYFVAVAEELNLTRAAARLHVAQPALSRQMKDLEEELETRLFERNRNGVQLTRGGKAFYQRARAILTSAAEAANEARTAAGVISGRLVLGFMSGLHLDHLAPVIDEFRRAHPKVEFDFQYSLQAEQMKAVRAGRIEVAFVYLPAELDGLAHEIIWRLPVKVVLPQRHPLARRRSLDLADLRNEEFVFCTRESRPEFYDEFFHRCANAGFHPRIVKEVGGYPTNMLGLIALGTGVSVLPHFGDTEKIRGLVWRPLTNPLLWIDFALVWRSKTPSRVVTEFVDLAVKRLGVKGET